MRALQTILAIDGQLLIIPRGACPSWVAWRDWFRDHPYAVPKSIALTVQAMRDGAAVAALTLTLDARPRQWSPYHR